MELSTFLSVLQRFEIKIVADVRSNPRSQRNPQFDQAELEGTLKEAGVRYLFLGEELGGRPEDPKVYRSDGLVDYRVCRRRRGFMAGVERLVQELSKSDVVLMCAEEDPLSCHRFLMICPEFTALGIEPIHIRKGGYRETQRDAEDRLLNSKKMAAVAGNSLFAEDRMAALESAYVAQSETCAFRIDPSTLDIW